MLINLRNAMMSGGKLLPYDAEVEYLATNGIDRPYIDTGVKGAGDVGFEAEWGFTKLGSADAWRGIFGSGYSQNSGTTNYWITGFSGVREYPTVSSSFGPGPYSSLDPMPLYGRANYRTRYTCMPDTSTGMFVCTQKYSENGGVTWRDGGTSGVTNTFADEETPTNLCLFAISYLSGSGMAFYEGSACVTVFGFKLYKSGALVRDYIPVRKGTVGYLYDRVSGALFGNAGTGDFVLGPDI